VKRRKCHGIALAAVEASDTAAFAAEAEFLVSDWLPIDTAFARIRDAVGSRELAAKDLHSLLLKGPPKGLRSAYRRIDRDGKTGFGELSPDFWQQFTFDYRDRYPSHLWIRPTSDKAATVLRSVACFYGRIADPYRLYSTGKGERQDDVTRSSRRRRPGPATTHDWLTIAGEIARRCHDKYGRVLVPKKQSDLVNDMLAWCAEQLDKEPPLSEMKEAVSRICAALREV
jgi:hypothetical protein